MSEQWELFETGNDSWRKKLCQSIPADVRQEVIGMLAQMGNDFLRAARQTHAIVRKESDDES
jgi:hypothetical protein